MLKVKTKVKESSLGGLGLFADEFIPKGAIIWEYSPKFDISFTKEEFDKMDKIEQDLLLTYSYFSKESGKFIYSIDNSRFTNHSSLNPNEGVVDMGKIETSGVALRDINIGEEILINYRTFDANDEFSNEEYLNK
jgi:SET domain-containing protein